MVYGALTKGFTAIATELLVAAQRMGLYHALMNELTGSQGELLRRMERTVVSMPPRSRRWVGEMEEIAVTFNAVGLTPKNLRGSRRPVPLCRADALGRRDPGDHEPRPHPRASHRTPCALTLQPLGSAKAMLGLGNHCPAPRLENQERIRNRGFK